jgi:hypothetical protein
LLGPLLAGCSQAQVVERACTPPRAYWEPQHNFDGLMPPINRVSLDRNNIVYWNGRAVSLRRLSRYLGIVHGMNPEPLTFLDSEMGAPCATMEAIRDEMDRRLECRNSGRCAEGIMAVWEETPTPPGTPPS